MSMTRRKAGRLILGAPAIAAAATSILLDPGRAAAQEAGEGPSPLAKFLAKQEDGLSREERAKVREDATSFEQALRTLREFPIGNDVPPAGSLHALRSKRAGGR